MLKKNQKPERCIVNASKGFTLVEVLIYSLLLVSLFGAAFVVVNNIIIINDHFLQRNELAANHELIERKLEWVFAGAKSVELPEKNATSSSELRVTTHASGTDPAVFSFDGDDLLLSLAGGVESFLTNGRAKPVSFLVEHFSTDQVESFVKVDITLEIAGTVSATSTSSHLFVLEY